ncbi:MAG: hypothetical protein WBA10_14375 [Elainellaceae cyanobacterium]
MFIVDLVLRNSPVTLSVQRKEEADAKALYQIIFDAMRSGDSPTLELTCEQQTDKTIAVLVNDIVAVQLTQKSGTSAASGRPPGFFALAE